jgi:SAM-dependent methyltransferase
MEEDRIKWDIRYGGAGYLFSFTPSRFLAQSLDLLIELLPDSRRTLDLACGEGRNGIFLAQNGFQVTAVDISPCGIDKGVMRAAGLGVRMNFVQADLETFWPQETYDLIINFNFLLRARIPVMIDSLAPNGVIVMETIMDTPSLQGMHTKSFLLQRGELETLFAGFDGSLLLAEEEHAGETPVARVIFRKAGKG